MEEIERSEEEALGQLGAGLALVALRALGDHDQARDAAQEAQLRVLTVLRSKGIPQGYTLETYAYGTLRHVIADSHRSKRHFTPFPQWLAGPAKSALEELVDSERVLALARALRRLPVEDRELLERCYVSGEKVVDIALQTGEPAERIRKRKSRAIERLRAFMTGHSGHIGGSIDD